MMASSSGEVTSPGALKAQPTARATANEAANPSVTNPSRLPPELLDVDLQPGQEQQEGQADQRQDLQGHVHLDPAEHGGPEHDAGDDLQHRARQPQRRRRPEQKRDRERDHGHKGEP
jgi:hypothetical protein